MQNSKAAPFIAALSEVLTELNGAWTALTFRWWTALLWKLVPKWNSKNAGPIEKANSWRRSPTKRRTMFRYLIGTDQGRDRQMCRKSRFSLSVCPDEARCRLTVSNSSSFFGESRLLMMMSLGENCHNCVLVHGIVLLQLRWTPD